MFSFFLMILARWQEAEHAFWMDFERGRAVCVPAPTPPLKTFHAMEHGAPPEGAAVLLNRYWGALNPPAPEGLISGPAGGVGGPLSSRPPRPESYREDAEAEKVGVCHELAAAAESGWDFSSRWARVPCGARRDSSSSYSYSSTTDEGEAAERQEQEQQAPAEGRNGGKGKGGEAEGKLGGSAGAEGESFCLYDTATTSVVPVDLNAFLHRAELNIARLHHALALMDNDEEIEGCGNTAAAAAAAAAGATAGGLDGEDLPQPPRSPRSPPPLLSLDEIQRRFLSRRRGSSTASWSSSSSSLAEEPAHDSEAGSGADAEDDEDARRNRSIQDRPLGRKVVLFLAAARARAKAMDQTMWDERAAVWRDLLLPTGEICNGVVRGYGRGLPFRTVACVRRCKRVLRLVCAFYDSVDDKSSTWGAEQSLFEVEVEAEDDKCGKRKREESKTKRAAPRVPSPPLLSSPLPLSSLVSRSPRTIDHVTSCPCHVHFPLSLGLACLHVRRTCALLPFCLPACLSRRTIRQHHTSLLCAVVGGLAVAGAGRG